MGCDIHMVLEVKEGNKWVGINSFSHLTHSAIELSGAIRGSDAESIFVFWKVRSRNYDLFGKLAGVRREGLEPRGDPGDLSGMARIEIEKWGVDSHSHSYGLLSEIGPLFAQYYLDDKNKVRPNQIDAILNLFGVTNDYDADDLSKYRLVYWFDN